MKPRRVSTPDRAAALDPDALDLAVLQHVDAAPVRRAGVAPGDRVVAHRAAATLQEPALDRKAGVVVVELGVQAPDRGLVEQFGIDAVHHHGIAAPRVGVALAIRVVEVQDAALAHHGVVVDVLFEPFPELHRMFVERDVAGKQVVRADDGGVAADVAAPKVAFLDDRDVGDAVAAREVPGRREPVPAAAHDDDVVFGFRLRIAPDRFPVPLAPKRLGEYGDDRIAICKHRGDIPKRRQRVKCPSATHLRSPNSTSC